MRVIGVLLVAVPFAFAAMRLRATADDMRYVWMAIASTACTAAILLRPGSPAVAGRVRTVVAAIAAAAAAASVAFALGARAVSGIATVTVAFGCCSAVGTWLFVRSSVRGSGRS